MIQHIQSKLTRHKSVLFFLCLSLLFLIATRFVFLETSARFVWDESDDLVRMSQMYHRNPITLIGPMNANKTFFQSSLTYYMLMPGAILTNFSPMGTTYMTAVYGCLLVILFALLLWRFFNWNIVRAILFLSVLFPFVQTGRWAWNPHFIPFWQTIAFILFLTACKSKKQWLWLFVGFIFALSFHNHWYGFFSVAGFSLGVLFYLLPEKKFKEIGLYACGVFGSILPMILFDLLHPPGLFITRALFFSPVSPKNGAFNLMSIPAKLIQFPIDFIMYFVQIRPLAIVFLLVFLWYVFIVLKDKGTDKFKKMLLLPIAMQIIGLTFIGGAVFDYYYLGAVVSFVLFLAIPDAHRRINLLRIVLIWTLFIVSLYPSYQEIRKDTWMTNIGRKMKIYQVIRDNLPKDEKCNVFVPASKSGDAVGKIYRDLLIARDDVWLHTQEEYGDYKCLFVVSTATIDVIHKDPAYELDRIRKLSPIKTWTIDNTDWRVHYFVVPSKEQT